MPCASNGVSHPQQQVGPILVSQTYFCILNGCWLIWRNLQFPLLQHSQAPQIQKMLPQFISFFFNHNLLNYLVEQCNLYARQYIASNPNSSYACLFVWKPLTGEEFKNFLGLALTMGLTKRMKSISTGPPNLYIICQSILLVCP